MPPSRSSDFDKAEKVISFYVKAYKVKYKVPPMVNRNKIKYDVINMLKDITMQQAYDIIDYYISHYLKPQISDLLYKYDDLMEEMNTETRDKQLRSELLRETENNVKAFRERFGKN